MSALASEARGRLEPVPDIDLPNGRIFIGGEWREGRGAEIRSIYPADRSLNRVLRGASRADVEEAIARARKATADLSWRRLLPHHRAHRPLSALSRTL